MKKVFFIALFSLVIGCLFAQKTITSTNEFTIEGVIEKEMRINLGDLTSGAYPTKKIDSVLITNHLGEKRSGLKNLEVIPIRNILEKVQIKVESPKQLSEFYFVFLAADGYKVVFSWNEIFNNALGEEIYLIIKKDGKTIADIEERISIFSATDLRTGRRYVKGLEKIMVKRVE